MELNVPSTNTLLNSWEPKMIETDLFSRLMMKKHSERKVSSIHIISFFEL